MRVALSLGLAMLSSATAWGEAFVLRPPAGVAVAAGGDALLAVSIQRKDYQGPVTITFLNLPPRVQIGPPTPIAEGQSTWRGSVQAGPDAAPGTTIIQVRARAGDFIQEGSFELIVTSSGSAQEQPDKPEELILPAPFTAPPAAPPISAPVATSAGPADRWLFMKVLQGSAWGTGMDTERIGLYGWTEMSYTGSTDRQTNLPMGFNYVANDFLLQQNWLRFERTVLTSGTSDPSFGWRIDTILPGSDYRFTLPRGLWNSQLTASDGRPNRYGVDPIQMYAEAYFPTVGRGMDVKIGRFFAQYGVESNAAVDNYFVSHMYGFIYDPFTQVGLLTTTKATDAWSYQAGIVNGNDVFIDPASSPYGIGSVKWAAPTRPDSVLVSFIVGSGRFNTSRDFHNPDVFDLVYTRKLDARTTWIVEALYGLTYNVPEIGFANWGCQANYLAYTFTPRLAGVTRLEFFDDAQGQRTGFKGLYTAWTVGVNFKPRKDIILRPEIRYDHNGESRPFQGHHDLLTSAMDVIFRW